MPANASECHAQRPADARRMPPQNDYFRGLERGLFSVPVAFPKVPGHFVGRDLGPSRVGEASVASRGPRQAVLSNRTRISPPSDSDGGEIGYDLLLGSRVRGTRVEAIHIPGVLPAPGSCSHAQGGGSLHQSAFSFSGLLFFSGMNEALPREAWNMPSSLQHLRKRTRILACS